MWFFRTVVESMSGPVSVGGFQAAAAQLHDGYSSPLVFSTDMAGQQRDGAASYRILTWNGSAFVYSKVFAKLR
jgi:hypothetical protein